MTKKINTLNRAGRAQPKNEQQPNFADLIPVNYAHRMITPKLGKSPDSAAYSLIIAGRQSRRVEACYA